jgi:hypothetical protein
MKEPTRFLSNEKGERIAVIMAIEEYEKLLEELEELRAIRELEKANASGEIPIPFEEAIERIEGQRILE